MDTHNSALLIEISRLSFELKPIETKQACILSCFGKLAGAADMDHGHASRSSSSAVVKLRRIRVPSAGRDERSQISQD